MLLTELRKLRLVELQHKLRNAVESEQLEVMTWMDRQYKKFSRDCMRQKLELTRTMEKAAQDRLKEQQEELKAVKDSMRVRGGVRQYGCHMVYEFMMPACVVLTVLLLIAVNKFRMLPCINTLRDKQDTRKQHSVPNVWDLHLHADLVSLLVFRSGLAPFVMHGSTATRCCCEPTSALDAT